MEKRPISLKESGRVDLSIGKLGAWRQQKVGQKSLGVLEENKEEYKEESTKGIIK